jgi:hypothetical protein
MTEQFREPKLRSADLALRLMATTAEHVLLMATTAEHVRDCQRCYEILTRGVGEKLDEMVAEMLAQWLTSAQIQSPVIQRGMLLITPSTLWPLLSGLYPGFVTCDHWPKVEVPR